MTERRRRGAHGFQHGVGDARGPVKRRAIRQPEPTPRPHTGAAPEPAPVAEPPPAPPRRSRSGSFGLLTVRYGIGGVLTLVGVVLLIVSPGGLGAEGFGLCAGAGLSIIMVNVIYRLGVTGDREREREEEARRYMAAHDGHWPDEPDR